MEVKKDLWGAWSATQDAPMFDNRVLRISTYKGSRGAIETHTTSGVKEGGFFSVAFGPAGGGDFMEKIASKPGRGTEKAIRVAHEEAIAAAGGVDALVARAKAFYKVEA